MSSLLIAFLLGSGRRVSAHLSACAQRRVPARRALVGLRARCDGCRMPQPQGIGGVFDRVADTYDAVGVPWFTPIAAGLVDELAVTPGERVLDIGCGRGAALRPLALATGSGGRAVGIDLAPRMVELTALDLADLPQVEVLVGDAQAPAFAPASFDVAAASLVLFFLPDPAAGLRAWAELVVPDGRIGVSTFGAQDERWRAVDEVFVPYLPAAML